MDMVLTSKRHDLPCAAELPETHRGFRPRTGVAALPATSRRVASVAGKKVVLKLLLDFSIQGEAYWRAKFAGAIAAHAPADLRGPAAHHLCGLRTT